MFVKEATLVVHEEAGCLKAPDASEALEGNSNSHTLSEIITVESSSSLGQVQPPYRHPHQHHLIQMTYP